VRSILGSLMNKAPISYAGRGSPWSLPTMQRTDSTAQMAAMGSVGTLFAIIDRLCTSTGMVEWQLYRKSETGIEEDRTPIKRHAALDLWNRPNPWMERLPFIETFQQHVDLTGEGWWVIARSPRARSIPLELWPVRPDRMTPVPDQTNFIRGYVYTGPEGEQVPLEPDEVIRLRKPDPLDIYRGMSAVQTILADLDANRFSAEWNRNFFLNSAEPGGIIEVDKRLDDDEFDQLRDRWAEQHRGVGAAHRVALIEQGMKWVDRKITQRDMQFVELRAAGRDVIREAFGMPKFVLGDVEDVNRASARESSVFFNQYLVVPRLERIKSTLNAHLLPLYKRTGQGLEFDYDSPVPPDRESDNEELTAQTEGALNLVNAGYDPKAVLEAVGLKDMNWVGPPTPPQAPAGEEKPPKRPAKKKAANRAWPISETNTP
jgi:HK97 family phage portal protein